MLTKEIRLKHYKNVLKNYQREYRRRTNILFFLFTKEKTFKNYDKYYEGICHALLKEYRTIDMTKFLSLKEVLDMYIELKNLSIRENVYTMCGHFYPTEDLKSRVKLLKKLIKILES
jgi:gluconate kinase